MANIDLENLIRDNIRTLVPYSSARDEFKGSGAILLDANESPFNTPYNRYPDPLQKELKVKISSTFGVPDDSIFLGNGSDEAIDLLIRAFCTPGTDNIICLDPSYGMYEVCANINDVTCIKVLLNDDFSLNSDLVLSSVNTRTKVIFLCSPNNPTSNLLDSNKILHIIETFKGLVIVDEAYIDFSGSEGFLKYLKLHTNLVVLRTFSKAWSLAGVRLGMAFADRVVISVLNKIKYPYNVNILTQNYVMKYLKEGPDINKWIMEILKEKKVLLKELPEFGFIKKIHSSDANFLLVAADKPMEIYMFLRDRGLVVRDRSRVSLCEGCLRITVGTAEENRELLKLLSDYEKDISRNKS